MKLHLALAFAGSMAAVGAFGVVSGPAGDGNPGQAVRVQTQAQAAPVAGQAAPPSLAPLRLKWREIAAAGDRQL